jgi:hypothetical protein
MTIYGTFPDGGILAGDGSSLSRIDANGTVWKDKIAPINDGYYNIVKIGPNGNIYTNQNGALVGLSVSSRFELTLDILAIIVVTSVLAIAESGKGRWISELAIQ